MLFFKKKKQKVLVKRPINISIDDLDNFVYKWNLENPIDRWWRQKYGIAFNSSRHRDSNFIDMLFEFKEDKFFKDLKEQKEYKEGDWIVKREMSDEDFDNINLDDFDLNDS